MASASVKVKKTTTKKSTKSKVPKKQVKIVEVGVCAKCRKFMSKK